MRRHQQVFLLCRVCLVWNSELDQIDLLDIERLSRKKRSALVESSICSCWRSENDRIGYHRPIGYTYIGRPPWGKTLSGESKSFRKYTHVEEQTTRDYTRDYNSTNETSPCSYWHGYLWGNCHVDLLNGFCLGQYVEDETRRIFDFTMRSRYESPCHIVIGGKSSQKRFAWNLGPPQKNNYTAMYVLLTTTNELQRGNKCETSAHGSGIPASREGLHLRDDTYGWIPHVRKGRDSRKHNASVSLCTLGPSIFAPFHVHHPWYFSSLR